MIAKPSVLVVSRWAAPAGVRRLVLIVLMCAAWLSACGDPEQEKKQQLERAVDQVTRILNDATRNAMAAASLQSILEQGGTPLHYLTASLPEKFNHRISMDKPQAPWSVVLRDTDKPYEIVVEGYGIDLAKPLFTRTAKIGPPPARQ